jgi:hypothetical protein
MRCFFCFGTNLKPSRIRWYFWPLLVFLLRPFRCCGCGHRSIGLIWTPFRRSSHTGPLFFPTPSESTQKPPGIVSEVADPTKETPDVDAEATTEVIESPPWAKKAC